MPGIPAALLPSSLFDDDIRLGLGDWLRAFALPVELFNLPLSNRDVRLEVQARQDFVDDARRERVIRARFTTMIAALPALLIIASGVSLTAQLELIRRGLPPNAEVTTRILCRIKLISDDDYR